eukprot:scaffold966_cov415-Prasinococcus_capsulatus_cf.AAC.11
MAANRGYACVPPSVQGQYTASHVSSFAEETGLQPPRQNVFDHATEGTAYLYNNPSCKSCLGSTSNHVCKSRIYCTTSVKVAAGETACCGPACGLLSNLSNC